MSGFRLLVLTCLLLAALCGGCGSVDEPTGAAGDSATGAWVPCPRERGHVHGHTSVAMPPAGVGGVPSSAPLRSRLGPEELVEALRASPEAVELVRRDPDLPKRINRKPSIPKVVSEILSDPGVFYYRVRKTLSDPWVLFGFGAQALFFMRFLIQWIASERRKRSHIPVAFWYFSLAGGITLFAYAVRQLDPVFILGQGLGCFIYIRNLILIHRHAAGQHASVVESAE